MMMRPEPSEASVYYWKYIDHVAGDDPLAALRTQLVDFLPLAASISEERSLHRYDPEKWSIREVLNHVTDAERLFTFRAFWFARGLESALPSFDQDAAAQRAESAHVPWRRHAEEFEAVRRATIALFENMPADGWLRGGIASDNPVTVRALAYITAGHFAYHMRILKERYL